jgi:acetyltransferase-like isoleucine patch superfamily enzyme
VTDTSSRTVPAVHGRRDISPDPPYERSLADGLREQHTPAALIELYARFTDGVGEFDAMMRRVLWRAVARAVGDGLTVGRGVSCVHLETFEIGRGVWVGDQVIVQGRFDGSCTIGDHVWIGAQSYFDARHLVIEDSVGWGPGAKVLGATHTGIPSDVPVIETDLEITPVRISSGVDVGVNAVVLPGVTISRGAIVGAGAVVTRDVDPFAIVAGVPARFVRWRDGHDRPKSSRE